MFCSSSGTPAGQVVVEQHGAGIEVFQPQAAALAADALQRFQHQLLPVGQVERGGFGDLRQQAADAHVQPGVVQDGCQARDVHQVELVARVVLRHQQEVPRLGADLLDRRHGGLHAQRQEGRIQVVEAAGEQVGIDRRQLEAGIAQVDRAVKRRRVLQPLRAQPPLDRRCRCRGCAARDRAAGRSVR
jgi:hypothetical protein